MSKIKEVIIEEKVFDWAGVYLPLLYSVVMSLGLTILLGSALQSWGNLKLDGLISGIILGFNFVTSYIFIIVARSYANNDLFHKTVSRTVKITEVKRI